MFWVISLFFIYHFDKYELYKLLFPHFKLQWISSYFPYCKSGGEIKIYIYANVLLIYYGYIAGFVSGLVNAVQNIHTKSFV